MKKYLLSVIIGSFFLLLFGLQQAMAQDGKSSRVHITITEGDQVTTDTTFKLAEGQDPEMIQRMVSHMAGGDVHVKHSGDKKMVWVSSEDVDDDCEGKEKNIEVIVHSGDDMEWVEKGDGDENVEVYVIKNGDDVKVIKKKIIVETEDEDPVEVEMEVEIEVEKEGKKKK